MDGDALLKSHEAYLGSKFEDIVLPAYLFEDLLLVFGDDFEFLSFAYNNLPGLLLKQLDLLILEADAGLLDMIWTQKNKSSDVAQSERDRRQIHFEVLERDLVE